MTLREREDEALGRLFSLKLSALDTLSRCRPYDEAYDRIVTRVRNLERAMGRIVMRSTPAPSDR